MAEKVKCPFCNRSVPATTPAGGDGSAGRIRSHKGICYDCPGSKLLVLWDGTLVSHASPIAGGAVLSSDERFRYTLWRRWEFGPVCVWVMLNPSTADARSDDATIRRCVGFAKRWGYAGIEVVNLYALRSTDPKVMLADPDRTGGSENKEILSDTLLRRSNCVCAWGNNAEKSVADAFVERAEDLIGPSNVKCLGVTKSGAPRHPVRLPYWIDPVPLAVAQGRVVPETSQR